MIGNNYSLQLLSSKRLFNTREDAVQFIKKNFKALWAEPALFFYGEPEDPKMILAVGITRDGQNPKMYLMDDGLIKEIVTANEELVNQNAEQVAQLNADLASAIEAAGLYLNENEINDRVHYVPDSEDDVLRGSQSLAEAIARLSEYAQSINTPVSKQGENDNETYNDNIITAFDDGLFAAVDLNYDATNNVLTFSASGTNPNGTPNTQLRTKSFNLGKHSTYEEDNENHTVTITIVPEEDNANKISADVKVSQDEYNMLEVRDNHLFVPKVMGGETGTAKTTVTADDNGGYTVTTDVTLPGFKLIDKIEYDSDNNDIIIYYYTGEDTLATVSIPLENVFDITDFAPEIERLDNKIDTTKQELENVDNQIYAKTVENKNAILELNGELQSLSQDVDNMGTAQEANIQEIYATINKNYNDHDDPKSNFSLNGRVAELESDVDSIVLKLVDESNPRLYGLYVDNDLRGQVNIPQNELLTDVIYEDNKITLVFENNQTAVIDLTDLIDAYNGGNGIDITNNTVSVKLSSDASNLLEFAQGGYLTTKPGVIATTNDVNDIAQQLEDLSDTVNDEYATKLEVNEGLTIKANANEVYTKTESDNRFAPKFQFEDSTTIDFNMDNSQNLQARVIIDPNNNNALGTTTNGLYSNVNLDYNSATNTLTFTVNGNSRTIELVGESLVTDVQYDAEHKSLILTISDGGTERQITVPLGDLVDTYTVDNTHTNVELNIDEHNAISANAVISSLSTNALTDQNDGLYVSNNANDYVAHLNDVDMSVQEAIVALNGNINNIIDQFNTTIASLGDRLQEAEDKIANLESIIAEMVPDGEYADFADYGERIARLEAMTGDYNDFQGNEDTVDDGF